MTPESLGRYRIVDQIGQGAMGVVYRARDPIIDRVVALKTIDPHLSGDALREFNERFFHEAKSAGRLNHPNIVTIYDAGEADGNAYIAMEYLEGPSLRQILDDHPTLPVSRVMEIGAQVARGLAYAHEHGVVHRDVKPANVILVNGRRPKITDFGIAGAAGAVNSELAGSPKYMSPEQVRGEALDGRADVFSLGAVLYELLTGKQPFTGEDVESIIAAVREHEPPPPSTLNARVPRDVDRVVMRMLAKRAEDRYTTARRAMRHLGLLAERAADFEKAHAAEAAEADAIRQPREPAGEETTVVLGMAPPATRGASRYWAAAGVAAAVVAMVAWNTRTHAPVEPVVVTKTAPAPVASAPVPAPVEEPLPAPAPAAQPAPAPKRVAPAAKAPRKPPVEAVQAPAPVEPEPAPQAPPPAREVATLQLAVSPWGEIFIDGQSRGTSPPLASIQVPPGTYRVEVRNSTLAPYRVEVSLGSGDTRRIKHRFE